MLQFTVHGKQRNNGRSKHVSPVACHLLQNPVPRDTPTVNISFVCCGCCEQRAVQVLRKAHLALANLNRPGFSAHGCIGSLFVCRTTPQYLSIGFFSRVSIKALIHSSDGT